MTHAPSYDMITQGTTLTLEYNSGKLTVSPGVGGSPATVVLPDVGASNGIVHAIDTVIKVELP